MIGGWSVLSAVAKAVYYNDSHIGALRRTELELNAGYSLPGKLDRGSPETGTEAAIYLVGQGRVRPEQYTYGEAWGRELRVRDFIQCYLTLSKNTC